MGMQWQRYYTSSNGQFARGISLIGDAKWRIRILSLRSKHESGNQFSQVDFDAAEKEEKKREMMNHRFFFSMSKVLKTMGKDDSLTIRVNDDSDSIIIAMESQSTCGDFCFFDQK